MQFTFNYSSLRDFFTSFQSPRAELRPGLTHAKLRVQKRGSATHPEYHLRFSNWGNITYIRLEESELSLLAEALNEIKTA
ncbi:MAG: hypothetical protein AAF672_04770 [Pseudomonadota bacterium]